MRFDQVGVDNADAMRLLIDHAVAFGHRRVGTVAGHPGFATTLERIEGFQPGARGARPRLRSAAWRVGNATTADAAASTHALLSLPLPPSVLVTGNNLATIGAMRAIRERGLAVPADLS